MDFNLTEERGMLRDTLGRFLRDKYDHGLRRRLEASGQAYCPDVFEGLAELGVLGALFSEEHGGFGGSGFDLAVVFEELGRAGTLEPILPAVLAGGLIAEAGRTDLVEEIIAGTTVATLAHGEAGARYDQSHVTTSAKVDGDQIVLSGTKSHVLNGAQARLLVVSARESGAVMDEAGISLFLVPSDAIGVTITDHVNLDSTSAATVVLDSVRLDASVRIGSAGEGFELLEASIARGVTALCVEALGAMEAAKTLTLEYLKERRQFGVPIGSFQALQHRMADVLIEIEQARSAVINLAGNLHRPRLERERHVSAAKNMIGRVATLVVEECIQLHGGIAMTEEYALSHFARRLTMIDHLYGDVDHHLERFITLSAA
ncbi:acyl-CoA dehydrogenase family protein [Tropicibacter sp. Alg240-R139]|uniref:acyl-CoA dehydrogenase family protein n=1 Tax=Tropicibacter sp. Alg240-R139 TaxID=2305991 RepID=UPI0013E07B8D|nr:acyl-CoA dehydrogenase [Tropicibacter sp. Alg240-R139]